ncbi:MAG TPA: hypothetical protein VNX86_04790 [Rhizomicrobium sp.]|jgi:hypothetical protein|nr:hypothetical protein [Rhizomicrobium sp.]
MLARRDAEPQSNVHLCVSASLRADLSAFLAREASLPFVWGVHDCATFIADWYVAATGAPDPIAEYRGTYADEAQCLARWGRGYVLRMATRVIARLGLPRTIAPVEGDIGLVALREGMDRTVCCAIRTRGWVMRGETGLTRLPVKDALSAWRITA